MHLQLSAQLGRRVRELARRERRQLVEQVEILLELGLREFKNSLAA